MHLSQRLVTAACLCASATAFIPYTIKVDASTSDSARDTLSRRFLPLPKPGDALTDDSVSSSNDESLTLNIKRIPVRRGNDFNIVVADTPSWPNTAALDQDGNDLSYFSVVNIGSENQALYMLLDTGGSDTWVFSSNCTSTACTMHNAFGANSSSTLEMTSDEWSVGYGTGSVSGLLGTDNLTIANTTVRMTFGLASNASDDFESYPMDGILGLGRTNESSYDNPTFMDAVSTSNLFKSNIVGFALSRSPAKDGTVSFGTADKDKYAGDITYTDTVGSGSYWRIPVDDAYVDGTSCDFSNKSAIIDTGTSYAMLPSGDAQTLHSLIPGSNTSGNYFIIPCNTTAKLQVAFSGVNYTISPKDYVGSTSGSGCVSKIVSYDLFGDDIWLLGDVFLKNVYAVFDFDEERVGFAERSSNTSSSSNSTSSSTSSASGSTATGSSTTTGSASSSTSSDTKSGGMAIAPPQYYFSALVIALYLLWL
ncbi:aspartic protease [Aspergillus sclerotioniger CBS 115572]|uniref:Aspartic protease n=1 Tax=Aspergillus sclerotioniger CBS 115572 TaxID=1450535 RepID=A0A317X533_9EURO|nr:aspartic protease [Aspergillus sclerotioniger CBS 115572]PWY93714.1 aspartic protease [Aspergillus sclerotioniger CBS 115572]